MQSLITTEGQLIATGEIQETEEAFIVDDSFYYKTIFGTAQIVDSQPPIEEGTWYFRDDEWIDLTLPAIRPSAPDSVTPRQARLVLALTPSGDEAFSTMLAKVEAAFASLPEPDKTVAQITWEYSTEVQRYNPLIGQMQAVIGFTDEQIDELFIQAAAL